MNATAETLTPFHMEPGVVAEVPLELIDLDPKQPRKDFDEAYVTALAADIKISRVKQPITVRPNPSQPGHYFIKYGECRYRASRQAGKQTIPALLDTEEETQGDPLARLLDQSKENHFHKPLNPMEWAGVLRTMRDDHKIKSIAAIEETLKRHGITNMGRSYISNLMRLAELPEWAQDLIRAGELTAAHGKYLLPACSSAAVTEALRVEIVEEGERPSVRELQGDIYDQFRVNHKAIDGPYDWVTPFDYLVECVKTGCQNMRKVSTEHQASTFCLNSDCHATKCDAHRQREAELRKANIMNRPAPAGSGEDGDDEREDTYATPVDALVLLADGSVDMGASLDADDDDRVEWRPLTYANFDVGTCRRCEHFRTAAWKDANGEVYQSQPGCFGPFACYNRKTNTARAERERLAEATSALNRWLRGAVAERLGEDPAAQDAVIYANALGLDGFGHDIEGAMDEARVEADIDSIADLLDTDVAERSARIAAQLLSAADAEILVPLAVRFGLALDGWRPDADWLHTRGKAQLLDDLLAAGVYDDSDRARLNALSTEELIERALEHGNALPVPAEITEAWARLQQQYTEGEQG